MNTLQEINQLDIEIHKQTAILAKINNKYLIQKMYEVSCGIIFFLGIGLIGTGNTWIILILASIISMITTNNLIKKISRALQTEEGKLIELQVERSRLWTEMMSGNQE